MTLAPIIAANRFGLGARPGELRNIGGDARGWLLGQISGTATPPGELGGLATSAEAFRSFAQALRQRRQRRQEAAAGDGENKAQSMPRMENDSRQRLASIYLEQVAARYRIAVRSDQPFRERLVHFWTNHFAVSADKVQVAGLAGTLENEAVRPHLAGRFEDLLMAVESHPAMILYLDNQASIGPGSTIAQRAAKRSGGDRKLDINENLAREILELHTLA